MNSCYWLIKYIFIIFFFLTNIFTLTTTFRARWLERLSINSSTLSCCISWWPWKVGERISVLLDFIVKQPLSPTASPFNYLIFQDWLSWWQWQLYASLSTGRERGSQVGVRGAWWSASVLHPRKSFPGNHWAWGWTALPCPSPPSLQSSSLWAPNCRLPTNSKAHGRKQWVEHKRREGHGALSTFRRRANAKGLAVLRDHFD